MKILFVHNGQERFVLDDLALLRETHHVTDWYQPGRLFNPVRLARAVARHDLVFAWFASWHALAPVLLARLARKPAVVIVGGYDTANLPEAGYGAQRGGIRRLVARTVIRSASRLITHSEATRREAITQAEADPQKLSVIYLAPDPLPAGTDGARACIALTVGGLWRENLLRKGLLPFVQAAAHLPDVRFVVAGRAFDDSIRTLRQVAGPNVEFTGYLPAESLATLYGQAAVYVQASLHEGFGLSVAEAMSAGCLPVVTRAGALPEVVGACGVYADSTDPAVLAAAIRQGLGAPDSLRRAARQRVLDCFPRQRRRRALADLLSSLPKDARGAK